MAKAGSILIRTRGPIKPGQKFSRITALARTDGHGKRSREQWLFRCECGTEFKATADNVRGGNTRSCGCLQREYATERGRRIWTTHGMSRTNVYQIWAKMVARCHDQGDKDFARYGARGIKVCRRWRSFPNFYKDMGDRPGPKMSIERTNNDGPYAPGNCVWANNRTQSRNRRNTHFVVIDGRSMSLIEACERRGLNYSAVKERLRLGWSEERALSTSVRVYKVP